MYFHHRDGGFWWHAIPTHKNGMIFSYHWPGFSVGDSIKEGAILELLRISAYRIASLLVAPRLPPDPPELLPFESIPMFSWRGSAGASGYDIQRAVSPSGPWETVAQGVSDADVAYRPLFSDSSAHAGRSYYYRVIAKNKAGCSDPSNVVGPVRVKGVCLADELKDFSKVHDRSPDLSLTNANNSYHAEYLYRAKGSKGQWLVYRTSSPIRSFKVIGWYPESVSGFAIFVSDGGKRFDPIHVKTTPRTYLPYQGRPFRQVTASGNSAGGGNYLRIEWAGDAELDRVEIICSGP
jgi:hypothetical protein